MSRVRGACGGMGIFLMLGAAAGAQDTIPTARKPKVIAAPIATVQVKQGASAPVRLTFRVIPGYHINSNKPKSELLLPTVMKFNAPSGISIGKVEYPKGEE